MNYNSSNSRYLEIVGGIGFKDLISINDLHSANANSSIEVTELGIVTEVMPLQPLNTLEARMVTLSPIVNVFSNVFPLNGEQSD